MAQTTLEDLVNEERFPDDNLLGVILYFPVGTVLVIIRLLVGILVWLTSAVLPEISSIRIFITNFTCFTLGLCVRNEGQRDEKARLMVSNSVSIFDPLALHVSTLCISPSKWDLPPPLAWALGIRHMGSPSSNEQFREAVKKKFADIPNIPMAAQPEGCPTSGKGLLKFSEWPFMLYDKVQPVAIDVRRWFGNVTTASLSHWSSDGFAWTDLFWFLWSPYTVFTVHLLPTVERIDKETSEEFANRVQKVIADYLKVEATQYSCAEVRSLVASREAGPAPARGGPGQSGPSGQGRPDLRRMAAQVKEVLPSVPLSVIIKDLGRTRSVDVTLSNILEGTIPYTPEEPSSPSSSTPVTPTPSAGPAPVSTAASCFPKTAEGRMLSFQERKAQLIQESRRRYCEKRGITHLL